MAEFINLMTLCGVAQIWYHIMFLAITKSVEFKSNFLGSLQWRHNERNGVSNHRRLDCLRNRSSRRWSRKTSKLRVTGPCQGNPPVTGGFPHQRASSVTRNIFPFDVKFGYSENLSLILKFGLFVSIICMTSGVYIKSPSFSSCCAGALLTNTI